MFKRSIHKFVFKWVVALLVLAFAFGAAGTQTARAVSPGTVVAWGYDAFGQATISAGLSDVSAIGAGGTHSLALKSDGTIVAWGHDGSGQATIPYGLSDVTAIAAGLYHSLALKSDGTIVAWGYDAFGQATVPAGLSDVTSIAAGGRHSLALVSSAQDSSAPTITITTPAEGETYLLGQAVNADYACQDEEGGSGLASCVGTVANGSPIDTSSVGSKSLMVNAADNAGNSASVTHNYSVVYNFSGFFQPVDSLPMVNTVKAGAGVPIKFSLGGNQGLNILAAGYPRIEFAPCTGGSMDAVETTVTTGSSSLSYDASTDQYTYIWKTEKAWLNKCGTLQLKFMDGTTQPILFKFSK